MLRSRNVEVDVDFFVTCLRGHTWDTDPNVRPTERQLREWAELAKEWVEKGIAGGTAYVAPVSAKKRDGKGKGRRGY